MIKLVGHTRVQTAAHYVHFAVKLAAERRLQRNAASLQDRPPRKVTGVFRVDQTGTKQEMDSYPGYSGALRNDFPSPHLLFCCRHIYSIFHH